MVKGNPQKTSHKYCRKHENMPTAAGYLRFGFMWTHVASFGFDLSELVKILCLSKLNIAI